MDLVSGFEGRVALVTGAGSPGGLGAAIAVTLARHGAVVAVTDIDLVGAEEVAAGIGGTATAFPLDVASEESVAEAVASIHARLGMVDILVNNAAAFGVTRQDALGAPAPEAWMEMFRQNVVGTVLPTQAVVPGMKERRYGKIVNISSIGSHSSRGTGGPYPSSKAAALRYTKGLARELAPFQVNVNAVCPGALWTGMQEIAFATPEAVDPRYRGLTPYEAFDRHYSELTPVGRPQTVEEVAVMAAVLASDSMASVTGQCVHVDGGMIIE